MLGKDVKLNAIKSVPLFAKLSGDCLRDVASIADEIDLPEGKELTREGERAREFIILLEGSAEVMKDGRLINTLGKGDFLGEIGLITKLPRTATVKTTSPVRALVMTDRDFMHLVHESPSVGQGVLEALGERLAPDLS